MRFFRSFFNIIISCICNFFALLPNDKPFCTLRLWMLRAMGYDFGRDCVIFANVIFRGLVRMGNNCSISNNCFLSGWTSGITLGDNVMIAPNCVIVSFNHGYQDIQTPMIDQPWVGEPVFIEDDVWIGANCTIIMGVTIGKGSIIAANAVVSKDIPPYSIVGGVPARILGSRLKTQTAEGGKASE